MYLHLPARSGLEFPSFIADEFEITAAIIGGIGNIFQGEGFILGFDPAGNITHNLHSVIIDGEEVPPGEPYPFLEENVLIHMVFVPGRQISFSDAMGFFEVEADIYDIKGRNTAFGGIISPHYDFSTGTLEDQSGTVGPLTVVGDYEFREGDDPPGEGEEIVSNLSSYQIISANMEYSYNSLIETYMNESNSFKTYQNYYNNIESRNVSKQIIYSDYFSSSRIRQILFNIIEADKSTKQKITKMVGTTNSSKQTIYKDHFTNNRTSQTIFNTIKTNNKSRQQIVDRIAITSGARQELFKYLENNKLMRQIIYKQADTANNLRQELFKYEEKSKPTSQKIYRQMKKRNKLKQELYTHTEVNKLAKQVIHKRAESINKFKHAFYKVTTSNHATSIQITSDSIKRNFNYSTKQIINAHRSFSKSSNINIFKEIESNPGTTQMIYKSEENSHSILNIIY
ncbi:hypothetical protein, partial [Schnuerera sp.]|uniref:hypothetical protein n=1 Tax=Schnuerera sp. TaxID=2794844 RepID=UPI002BAC8C41